MTELPKEWPSKKSLAVSVSIMLEAWTEDAAPGIGPMGNPLKAGVKDLQSKSWAEYGPRCGAWRILDILAAAGVKAVFYTSGVLAERYPDLVRAIADAGHDVAAHSWGQNIIPATQSPEAEAADLARCIETLERTSGTRPRGWLSPRCTPSAGTTDLLIGAGFDWHADYFDNDLPRLIAKPAGTIVAMPFTMEVNDMPLYIRYGNEPAAYTHILAHILEGWPHLPARQGCLDITAHAHVFGRPAGAIAFAAALAEVKRHEAFAFLTSHRALAAMWRRP